MIDEQKLRELAEDMISLSKNGLLEIEDVNDAPAAILALLDELATLRSERTALLVNKQNLREELEALRASLGEPVAVIGRDYQLLWARRDWSEGLNVGVNLYALSNKETP